MNVIAVSVRQAKGKANRLCVSAAACLRSLSVPASAANFDISRKDIRWRLSLPKSLSTLSTVFWLSTSLTVDLANAAADCEGVEDVEVSCAATVEPCCPPYSSDTPLKSCASSSND